MGTHVPVNCPLAGNIPIPTAQGIVNIILRQRAQKLMELCIGSVKDFTV